MVADFIHACVEENTLLNEEGEISSDPNDHLLSPVLQRLLHEPVTHKMKLSQSDSNVDIRRDQYLYMYIISIVPHDVPLVSPGGNPEKST